MDIDKLTIAVRPRGVSEVIDLALSLIRRYWWRLALLALLSIGLVIGLSYALTMFVEHIAYRLFVMMLFCFTLAPLAVAPITAFLGQSMFSTEPRVRTAFGMSLGRLGSLLAFAVMRFFPTALVAWYATINVPLGSVLMTLFLLIGSLFAKPHFTEVVVLERLPFNQVWKRVRTMERTHRGPQIGILAIGMGLCLALFWMFFSTIPAISGIITSGSIWGSEDDLVSELLLYLSFTGTIFMTLFLLAVIRFCSYLDYRIRSEGWDIELGMRRAGRHLLTGALR